MDAIDCDEGTILFVLLVNLNDRIGEVHDGTVYRPKGGRKCGQHLLTLSRQGLGVNYATVRLVFKDIILRQVVLISDILMSPTNVGITSE